MKKFTNKVKTIYSGTAPITAISFALQITLNVPRSSIDP